MSDKKHIHNVRWQVSLSDGSVFTEGHGDFADKEGELSPWQRLLKYMGANSSKITSLVLVNNRRTFNLPNSSKNPKFRRFDIAEKPTGYRCERAAGQNRNGITLEKEGRMDLFTIGIAVYKNFELQIWVDEHNPNNSWSLVVTDCATKTKAA